MKKVFFILSLMVCCWTYAAETADLAVSGIAVRPDRFVYVQLRNLSMTDIEITPMMKEKLFLTLYIDNIKRTEYKLKYLDPRLFKKNSMTWFRTNFRVPGGPKGIKVKAELNRLKIFPEKNFKNNSLERTLTTQ